MTMKSTRRVRGHLRSSARSFVRTAHSFGSTAHSFARTAHSFACSPLLASLARSAALIRSLARSLTRSRAHGKEIFVHELKA